MQITMECLECGIEYDVFVHLPQPPARMKGRPEDAVPPVPGSVEPEVCPGCSHPVDRDRAFELTENQSESAQTTTKP